MQNKYIITYLFFILGIAQTFASPVSEACPRLGNEDTIVRKGSIVVECNYSADGHLYRATRPGFDFEIRFHKNGVISQEYHTGTNGYGDFCYNRTRYNTEGMQIGYESQCGRLSSNCTYAGNYRLKCTHAEGNEMWTEYQAVEYAD